MEYEMQHILDNQIITVEEKDLNNALTEGYEVIKTINKITGEDVKIKLISRLEAIKVLNEVLN